MQEASGNGSTLVSQEEDALLADCPTKSQLESTLHLPSKQCEPVNMEQTKLTSPNSVDEGLQASNDVCAPLR